MRGRLPTLCLLLLAGISPAVADTPHHDLTVSLDPSGHRISVADRFTLEGVEPVRGEYHFVLHAGLNPQVQTPGWTLEPWRGEVDAEFFGINATSGSAGESVPLEGFVLTAEEGAGQPVEIHYQGKLHHPLDQSGEEYQRGFTETPGYIGEEGVFLAGASYWVPSFGDGLLTFRLDAAFPDLSESWDFVTQGRREAMAVPGGGRLVRWYCEHPVDEVYLVGGPWTLYEDVAGETGIYAFLRTPDEALATKYLDATKRYLHMYEDMLTPYPWDSFALVENFWDTGYGMPGFTLLGPQIIRFPFILTSSYPHEILHNWWGNSTYIDIEQGNWCEGLTAYMADHLFAEQRGEGKIHRRTTLQKYADFVREGKDFPLAHFRSRHSASTEAVGYGKALMVYHMLRRETGDEVFLHALSRFHQDNLYTRAGFAEMAAAFEAETGKDWTAFFEQWTQRSGAPALVLQDAVARPPEKKLGHWTLDLDLKQTQEERPFTFQVPVAVTVEGEKEAVMRPVRITSRRTHVTLEMPGQPLRVDIDPAFEVMRRLDPMEVPPAISTVLGEDQPVYVLPSAAREEEQAAWEALARAWQGGKEPEIVRDEDIKKLPGGAVWVLGWDNLFRDAVLAPHEAVTSALDPGDGGAFGDRGGSRVVVTRRDENPRQAMAWVAADDVAAIPGLARKLPHYTRYSYLAFKGNEPTNTLKGMWQPTSSPLTRAICDQPCAPQLALAPASPLAEPPPRFDLAALSDHVEKLSAHSLGGRGLGEPGLAEAGAQVVEFLHRSGLEPAGTNGFRQEWFADVGDPARSLRLTNILARKPGTDPGLADSPVLLMAHLDHLGRGWPDVRVGNEGMIHPGADDNASGVAVLMELARAIGQGPPAKRPILFAFTTGEEAGLIGSRFLLESLGEAGKPFACINLDTVGRLGDGAVMVLNADTAREWRFLWMGVQYTTGVPFKFVPEPLDSSDQTACIEQGVPAVQLFTGPHEDYHRPSDTADKVDSEGLVGIATSVLEAAAYLADRTDPLTPPQAGGGGAPRGGGRGSARRASLGTVPDFTFAGPGVRVEDVVEESPAEAAGIKAGDVLLALDGEPMEDLRGYSNLLKSHEPGDRVEVRLRRDGREMTLSATLGER